MKNKILCAYLLGILTACSVDDNIQTNEEQITNSLSFKKYDDFNDEKSKMYSDLSQSLNTSLINSYNFRELLKTEALKMFNKDYDVLLYTIQDIQLENGQTVKSILNKNLKNFNVDQILSNIPTLTIFIPELPENSFSASKWNLNEVPSIAFRSTLSNNIPYLDNNYNKNVIEANQIPLFPIIVLKENERIILSKNNANKQLKNGDNNIFEFWAEDFDNSQNTKAAKFFPKKNDIKNKSNFNPVEDKEKYIDAFDIYNPKINGGIDGWHRDYIYYNITPQQDRGEFRYNYQEFITNIQFKNDSDGLATSIYKKIADQTGDPTSTSASGWADGYFEIKVRSLINGSNGVGEELVTGITVKPSDFFEYNYKTTDPTRPTAGTVYLVGVRAKNTPNNIRIPSLQWDLKDYSSSIKVTFEEVDISETEVITNSRVTKFAGNFSIEATIKKIGLKFGANLETTKTVTNQVTRTLASDELGEAIINFGDRVLIYQNRGVIEDPSFPLKDYRRGVPSNYRNYSTGYLDFNVIPLRVQ
ncbi:hypothetical protein [Empedobacter brevis]|uniref:hypothetical protein n=1 Tax=Empedobacter brevis TaxID=247 RepID=UPI0028B15757|nr:hypothetical protein [Empedobacter brevis]